MQKGQKRGDGTDVLVNLASEGSLTELNTP